MGQFGFPVNHSTEQANTKLVDRIMSAFGDKGLPRHVFMDLSKAFDSLDHGILFEK